MTSNDTYESATPGKTKHFQTLFCGSDREIMLCDCPGLGTYIFDLGCTLNKIFIQYFHHRFR